MPNPGRPISLEGRVAIVTGGGRGLGRAHALALAAAGARVVVVDTGEALDGGSGEQGVAAAVVEEIRGAGGEAIASTEAVGSTKAAETLVATALDAYGRLDVLVNNAGISRNVPLAELDDALWERILAVHLGGTFTCTRAAFRAMSAAGRGGRIVNTTSGAGLFRAYLGSAAYASAKGAIAALTRVTAAEGEPHGITCNAIAPLARTRMSAAFFAGRSDGGEPALVSPLVVYLASAESAPVSGHVFRTAEGRLGVVAIPAIPSGCAPRGDVWTADEIALRIDEILAAQ